MTRVATIARNPVNSPNMTGNDTAILERVTAELKERGATVTAIGENEELPDGIDIVCTMSRTSDTLNRLKKAEEQGIIVINPTASVENCSRIRFMEILRDNRVPQPAFRIVDSADGLDTGLYPSWIKKAEGWSTAKEDVCFAGNHDEAVQAVTQMKAQGIGQYIQMQHCKGDIIKFYGVGNTLFHFFYPESGKFGHEEINGTPQQYPFDTNRLKETAQKAAKAIGLDIYGGDAIITPEGDISIIDINDFPSFTAIRDKAAKEIALLIMSKTV